MRFCNPKVFVTSSVIRATNIACKALVTNQLSMGHLPKNVGHLINNAMPEKEIDECQTLCIVARIDNPVFFYSNHFETQ